MTDYCQLLARYERLSRFSAQVRINLEGYAKGAWEIQLKILNTLLIMSAIVLGSSTAKAQKATLLHVPSAVVARVHYWFPKSFVLSRSKPYWLTKEPTYKYTPQYGIICFGSDPETRIIVALDEAPDLSLAILYVDANANGDLTDDAPVFWRRTTSRAAYTRSGPYIETVNFNGSADVRLKGENPSLPYSLGMYRHVQRSSNSQIPPLTLVYYNRDYGREGKLELGGKTYNIMVLDEMAQGRYDQFDHEDKQQRRVSVLIDRNGDGRFGVGEQFDIGRPINLGGTTYELESIARDGSKISFKKSSKFVPEEPLPAAQNSGKKQ